MSGSPFVKEEPQDFDKFMPGGQFGQSNGIDPSRLTMNGNNMNFGGGNMGSYGIPNGAIPDEDLDFVDDSMFNPHTGGNPNFAYNGHVPSDNPAIFQGSGSFQQPLQHISNTPSDAPIRSPFANGGFNYEQYQMSPFSGSMGINGARRMMERQPSSHRSPVVSRPSGLKIGTRDALQAQAMLNQQAKMASGGWDGTPGSGGSWIESPMASPHGPHMHPHILDVINTHGSVPTKMEGHSASLPSYQSQEAKKKRRRESHNMVERRRRDNINERIQDLSKLVPQHRLEDDKVRKHISTNGPMSPHGISPPQATSLLAGGGRRATGTITQGLPQEEKEKGPNKGDILNGAVAWMRDLLWMLYLKDQEQLAMKAEIERLGGTWELDTTEEHQRMMSELRPVVERTGFHNFMYSRAAGSGLRVPDFTNFAGEALDGTNRDMLIKADPGSSEPDLWFTNGGDSGRQSVSIKEEDDMNGMDMG